MFYYNKYVRLLKFGIAFIIAGCIAAAIFAQEVEIDTPEIDPPTVQNYQNYQITAVNYDITGMTKQYPLERAVPIDTVRVFNSKESLRQYITELEQQFRNIRTIESVRIDIEYDGFDSQDIIPVTLMIAIIDTWNFIAIPYPSFDSNSGFQLKLKMQDFNFVGSLQPLKADIVYRSTETGQQIFSSSVNFGWPFKAGIFDMLLDSNFKIEYAYKAVPKINIGTALWASYKINNHFSIGFGIVPEMLINDRSSTQVSEASTSSGTGIKQPDALGYLYPRDRYYFKTAFHLFTPVMITETEHFGSLTWTPSMNIGGNWAFDGIQAKNLKASIFAWGHVLSLSKVNWISNFREGLNVSLGNSYSYKFYKDKTMNIDFTASVSGYYSFANRVGVYGRMQFFYKLFNATSTQTGSALRGILNKRIDTDTSFAINLDIPIRIASLDFQSITGVKWARFLNCEIQLSPFLDMAFVHDKKTGRYYHPADGWYSGGLEVIVYPEKMRSIYVRASLGFDLSELKNVPGLNKLRGRAKRDGESIAEIFIGIGLHY